MSKPQPMYRWSGNAMSSRDKRPILKREVEILPSLDQPAYYDKSLHLDSDDSEYEDGVLVNKSNLNNKLRPQAQFYRRGKLAAWTPAYEDVLTERHARKRFAACLEQLMPAASAEVDEAVPDNIMYEIEQRESRKKRKIEDRKLLLPHLRSPSPPLTTEELAPMLAIPETYVDVMMSPSMKHTLGDDTVEQGLQRTASELLEGEKPLMQSLGRLRDILRLRSVHVAGWNKPRWEEGRGGEADQANRRPEVYDVPNKHETDNLWRITQGLLEGPNPPALTYKCSDPRELNNTSVSTAKPTPIQSLFTVREGITLATVPDEMNPKVSQYNIPLEDQLTAVDDAMERVSELLADCNEYKERLEEARDRVADVARARKKVWSVIKSRAGQELDRLDDKDLPARRL